MAVAVGEVNTGLLATVPQRPPELGRIRMGEKGPKGQPVKLRTFRLTSGSKALLEAAAARYGGNVTPWQGAPDEGQWQLTTASPALNVLIPTGIRTVSQAYELWQGGTCERRCDGERVSTSDGPAPCICTAKGLVGADRECDIVTRLSVMLPDIPGLGVWRLDTGGYQAATTLPSTVLLLSQLAGGKLWMPAVLRAEQRSKKERVDGRVMTHRFVVPVLDLPGTTLGQFIESTGVELPTPQLTAGERPAQPTAKERVAAERNRVENAQTVTAAQMEDGDWPAGATLTRKPDEAGPPQPVEVVAQPKVLPPPSAAAAPLTRCEAFGEGIGRCTKDAGHEGTHRSADQQTWK